MRSPKRLSGKLILVIEDEVLIALDVIQALERAGAATVHAHSVERANTHIHNARFDAAILDIKLAGVSCEFLCQTLTTAGVPFMILSGFIDGRITKNWPNVPRLDKPMDIEEVVATIERIATGPSPRQAPPAAGPPSSE